MGYGLTRTLLFLHVVHAFDLPATPTILTSMGLEMPVYELFEFRQTSERSLLALLAAEKAGSSSNAEALQSRILDLGVIV